MNKARIDELLPRAYDVLADSGIVSDGKIQKGYRGQIAAFGAAITIGSLLSAIAFFSKKGGSEYERNLLMKAIYHLVTGDKAAANKDDELFKWTRKQNENVAKEAVINAAIALKLAMNLYTLI
jgi:hypothetical protein